jgi:predicted Zn-dependent protease
MRYAASLVLALACAEPPPPPPPPAPPPERALEEVAAAARKEQEEGRIEKAHAEYAELVRRDPHNRIGWQGYLDTLILMGKFDDCAQKALALEKAPPDPVLQVLGAHARATAHAYAGRLDEAERAMREHLLWAQIQEAKPWPIFAFSVLIWLRWAQGDLEGALKHVDLLGKFLDGARLPEEVKGSWRLHMLWDRAYLLSDKGDRKGALKAEKEYLALAKKVGDEGGVPFLRAHLLLAEKKAKDAAAAVKDADPLRLDMQDQWIVWRARKAAGDASADEVRKRILSTVQPYMMHALIARELREPHPKRAGRL